jgi:hypothetical protein
VQDRAAACLELQEVFSAGFFYDFSPHPFTVSVSLNSHHDCGLTLGRRSSEVLRRPFARTNPASVSCQNYATDPNSMTNRWMALMRTVDFQRRIIGTFLPADSGHVAAAVASRPQLLQTTDFTFSYIVVQIIRLKINRCPKNLEVAS